jgi:hypothetical protein
MPVCSLMRGAYPGCQENICLKWVDVLHFRPEKAGTTWPPTLPNSSNHILHWRRKWRIYGSVSHLACSRTDSICCRVVRAHCFTCSQ